MTIVSGLGLSQAYAQVTVGSKVEASFIDRGVAEPQLLKSAITSDGSAFNVFTHGRPGELLIDGHWLDAKQISHFLRPKLKDQNTSLDHINIYGCEFAKGKKGLDAVAYLESALGLQVNASTNVTGAGGDWVLEKGNPHSAILVEKLVENYRYS